MCGVGAFSTIIGPQTGGLLDYRIQYSFHADAEETLDITAGTCSVLLEGEATWRTYGPGATFVLPGNRSFRFRCEEPVEYICGYAS